MHHNLPYGYFVDTLNGVSGYWDTAAMNGTYWHIKVLPDLDFHLGKYTAAMNGTILAHQSFNRQGFSSG